MMKVLTFQLGILLSRIHTNQQQVLAHKTILIASGTMNQLTNASLLVQRCSMQIDWTSFLFTFNKVRTKDTDLVQVVSICAQKHSGNWLPSVKNELRSSLLTELPSLYLPHQLIVRFRLHRFIRGLKARRNLVHLIHRPNLTLLKVKEEELKQQ